MAESKEAMMVMVPMAVVIKEVLMVEYKEEYLVELMVE